MQVRIDAHQARKPVIRNIRMVVAFDGTKYHGWQAQKDKATVQGILAAAIHGLTGEAVRLHGSGRTDAGTHARGLVANFHTASSIPAPAFVPALNRLLPQDIRILSTREAAPDFHARISARSKTYRYQIYRGRVVPPHLAREHFHYPYPLDLLSMQQACQLFVGEHDFASFAKATGAAGKGTGGTVRRILRCELRQTGLRLVLTVEGNGFLHHMVRNMAGTLLEVGRGRIDLTGFRQLFRKRDRTLAGFTAPAHGLILLRVRYSGAQN
jgi:tRNA pseudouridine38-40 synthase